MIEEFQKSGKSKVEFCKERGIGYQSLLTHLKRSGEATVGGFRRLVVGGVNHDEKIDFHFPDGRCVSFPVTAPKEMIRFLVGL